MKKTTIPYVAKHRSFEPFQAVFGPKAFSIVSLANGWADGMPADLVAAACFHDHFCCGVASGYFTARFITGRLPLAEGERYAYIGAPAWCQDDYLMYYLNLTPGKHGYYTMAYPWSRAWKTDQQTFSDLGGIVIRFNARTGRGKADFLRFDWGWDRFKRFLGEPDLEMDWKTMSWLHVWYVKYLFHETGSPERFVSVGNLKAGAIWTPWSAWGPTPSRRSWAGMHPGDILVHQANQTINDR